MLRCLLSAYSRLYGRDEDNVYLQHTASGEAEVQ